MTGRIIPFSKAGRAGEDRRGAGAAAAAPAASGVDPAERVRLAYRWTWRGAYRLRVGENVAVGYFMIIRAAAAGLAQLVGAEAAACHLARVALETGMAHADNDSSPDTDGGPRAA